jgi:HAD superfamily hydrolase (TIGR01450 family)
MRVNGETMSSPRGIILDLDGTVYRGERLIPGARETIEWLRGRGHPLVFVTNAIETLAEHVDKLAGLGVPARPEEIINAPLVLIRHLSRVMPNAVVFPICDPPLIEQLAPHFRLSEDPDEIDVVIASTDRAFDYRKLNVGFQALKRGARFWATNADPTWPQAGGEIPDVGAIIGALEGCTMRKVELVTGKPSPLVVVVALERLGRTARECIIVGDSLASDIAMGHQAGMTTALVLTGVTQRADLDRTPVQPDHILESIAELPGLLDLEQQIHAPT